MDFIRSLDDDENSPRGSGVGVGAESSSAHDPTAFVKTVERVGSNAAAAARRRPASAYPSSSFSSRSNGSAGVHVPLLHRPSALSVSDFPSDLDHEARKEAAALASLAAQQAFSAFHAGTSAAMASLQNNDDSRRAELRALKAQAAAHAESERAAAAHLSATALRQYVRGQEELMDSLDEGEYFRPHEQDALRDRAERAAHPEYTQPRYESHHGGPRSTAVLPEGATAGLGPGAATVPAPAPVQGSPLAPRLEGYKTRDLFYSQAQRAKDSREAVWIKARLDPAAGKHRPHETHVLEAEQDFPPTRKRDPGYRAGPDADRSSAAHPDVMLGLHRLRPSAEDLAHDALLTAQSQAHQSRRQQEVRVQQSVAKQLAAYTDMQKRREEETVRRQEDPYRRRAQQSEAEQLTATNPQAASKMRPTSAPLARTSTAPATTAASKRAAPKHATILDVDEDEEADSESTAVTSPASAARKTLLSPSDRARLDSRTALSHEDVQLLAENKILEAETQRQIAIEEGLLSPFSQRPPTAGETRRKAAAAGARYSTAGAEAAAASTAARTDRTHIHSISCGCASESRGAFGAGGGELPAAVLKHQAATGAKALSLFSPKGAGAAPAAVMPAGSSAQAVAAAAAATAANAAEAAANPAPLPLPFEAIDAHFRAEAWSLDRRSEGEIDALTRDFDAVLAKRERAAIAKSEEMEAEAERVAAASAQDAFIAGPGAAKIKADLRRAQARQMREEAHEALQQSRSEARDKLRLRTDEWPPEHLGLTRLDESAADHSKAAMKARQLALGKVGAQWGKVPSHDVAFNSSVIKRKEPPPPRGLKKKEEPPPPPPPPEPEPVRGRGARRSSQPDPPPPPPKPVSKKKPAVVKGRPGAYAGTKSKVVGIVEGAHRPAFLQQVLDRALMAGDAEGEVAAQAQAPDSRDAPTSFSFSAFRPAQDEKARRGKLVRPASAGMMALTAGGAVAALPLAASGAAAATGTSGAPLVRPSSAFLLGHGVTHPALLKSAASRATLLSTVSNKVHDHVARTEGLRTVEAIKDRFVAEIARVTNEEIEEPEEYGVLSPRESDQPTREARSALQSRLSISRRTLERALIAPTVSLDPRTQAKALPTQLSNLPVNPFLLPKKKKKKRKGKKGSSKKKKSGGASGATTKATPEAEGLAFPPGTAPGEWVSNPLVGDLSQIHLEDLVRTAQGKAELRDIFLRHASQLVMVWEMFSARTGGATKAGAAGAGGAAGVSLMNQFRFTQLAHIAGMFEPNAVAPGGGAGSAAAAASSAAAPPPPPPMSSRMLYEILVDDDDLSIESIDVDELLSRPSWLERLARMAVAKLGRVGTFPPRPLGETQPVQPVPPSAAFCLDRFLVRFLCPNALGCSPGDMRARMCLEPVQAVLEAHNIAAQVWFSHVAQPKAGCVDLQGVHNLVRDLNDSRLTDALVERALSQTVPHAVSGGFSGAELFFPEFLELLVRMATLSAPNANPADMAQTVTAFLTRAWASFAQRVPQAKETAAAIAASHAAQAAQSATPRAASRVKFS